MNISRRILNGWIVLALAFQGIVPLGMALPSPGTSEPLIICTQYGIRVIDSGGPSGPQPGSTGGDRRTADTNLCIVCASIDTARLSPPLSKPLVRPAEPRRAVDYAPRAFDPVIEILAGRAWPRAPPALA